MAATSQQLLKALATGAKIYCGDLPVGYAPRNENDRTPWALTDGRRWYWYAASQCRVVRESNG